MSNRGGVHTAESQAKRDRARAAEAKIKRLRVELDDLRKQVFRARETARIADEEALSLRQSLAAMTFSRDNARDRCNVLQGRIDTLALSELPVEPGQEQRSRSLLERFFGRQA